ncbi:YkuS family protein [Petroclostridium sp. X23]|uniref:YkuS family protein n=1 Tax=Petroclostridium sp. X23 TaxID=3045146 RepID=UPI0024ACE8ED|nr:YkuS family protein [Petroclostridium sp. X23]WHH61047.1 YkuS family protein [Petroclostridium sp. X23]
MGKKIAIEPALTPVKDFLNEKGYNVVSLTHGMRKDSTDYKQFDAIVVTGMSDDFAGMEDTKTDAVVIDASGLTPAQVENEIRTRTK